MGQVCLAIWERLTKEKGSQKAWASRVLELEGSVLVAFGVGGDWVEL